MCSLCVSLSVCVGVWWVCGVCVCVCVCVDVCGVVVCVCVCTGRKGRRRIMACICVISTIFSDDIRNLKQFEARLTSSGRKHNKESKKGWKKESKKKK